MPIHSVNKSLKVFISHTLIIKLLADSPTWKGLFWHLEYASFLSRQFLKQKKKKSFLIYCLRSGFLKTDIKFSISEAFPNSEKTEAYQGTSFQSFPIYQVSKVLTPILKLFSEHMETFLSHWHIRVTVQTVGVSVWNEWNSLTQRKDFEHCYK